MTTRKKETFIEGRSLSAWKKKPMLNLSPVREQMMHMLFAAWSNAINL